MKTHILILLAIISIAFVACNLEGESNFTPQLILVSPPINQNGDTIAPYYTDEASVFKLDTIRVGDTLSFRLYMTGIENNLTAFYIGQSADSVSRIILPAQESMDSIFLENSDYKTGKFLMNGTSTSLYFPFKYIAKKASLEAKISFTVVSDAKFNDSFTGSNTTSFTLKTPIYEAKELDK